jgi:hypothetical protein
MKRRVIFGVLIALVMGAGFAYRPVRNFVELWRLHLFTPVGRHPGVLAEARFLQDIGQLQQQVAQREKLFQPELKELTGEIARRQAAGKNVAYSEQIYRELRWRVYFTPDIEATRARMKELRDSLASDADQRFAEQQSPVDGSWGPGYTAWFMKLYGTVEGALSHGAQQKYPLTFLDRINSTESLTNYLWSVVINDFLKSGVVNRMEADESVSLLGRLILGDVECDYPFHPQLKEAYLRFVDEWQNPLTGCWGNWFVGRDGTRWRMDDVGMTFHIVSRAKANTKHLDRITRRVLQLSRADFPAGIRMNGRYENHLNWDVVKIFRYAWPTLDEPTKTAARAEMARMLHWCLAESYQPDGTFKLSELDDTFGDAMEFGVYFLRDIGFFRKQDRFWTDQEFPEAETIRAQIKQRIETVGLNNSHLRSAYDKL